MTEDLSTDDIEIEPDVMPDAEPESNDSKSFDNETVQKVVKRERQKAHDKGYLKGKQEALMELQEQQQQAQQAPQSVGGMQQASPADIERMISEHLTKKMPEMLQEQANQYQVRQTADAFISKMQAAESKYPGISEKLNDLDFNSMAPLVQMANGMDNTADIMNELLENPMKMGNLMTLVYTQPNLAKKTMMSLSDSIKQNEGAAAKEQQSRDPLSQVKSSTNTKLDSNDMSVTDLRKMLGSRK